MDIDLKPLEFAAIQRLLERLTATPYGADAARALSPAPERLVAQSMQQAVTIARQRLEAGTLPTLGQQPDLRPALRQAANPGAALSAQALNNLHSLLHEGARLAEALADTPAIYPHDLAQLQPPPDLLASLKKTLYPGGGLREDASPDLAEAYAERGRLRTEAEQMLRQRLDALNRESVAPRKGLAGLFSPAGSGQAGQGRVGQDKAGQGRVGGDKAGQDRSGQGKTASASATTPGSTNATLSSRVHWHQERAVLLVPEALADKIKGVCRGTASHGRDSIIEPIEVVAINNRLDTVLERINREQQRLLRALTDAVRMHREALEQLLSAVTWIDLASAAGRLSAQLNAHAPTLTDTPGVHLDQAYHPMLLLQFADGQGSQPVPLTLTLEPERRLLLLTGPNTGGKTVALKTLGLLVTMAWCGLHIPAEGQCTIGAFDRIMVDVGDQQSLLHHLSTFAGHVAVLRRVLDHASGHSLILLDELGTGTDPSEGAALAMAVLDELRDRGVYGLVNSHLPPLKDYAGRHAGIQNASMEFDAERLVPTYRLILGEPGISFGLTIAERNGLPSALIGRAREHLQSLV